jgi:hypothetical protein
METKTRRQAGVLTGLVVVFAAVLWWNMSRGVTPQTASPAPAAPAARTARAATQPDAAPLEVELSALKGTRPDPAEGHRNPFRFEPKPTPQHPPVPRAEPGTPTMGPDGQPVAAAPAGPPPPPPIPLKFIGFVEEPSGHRRLAALSDGRFTYYGREGDIIEGRYRIVRIGLESIEMVHVDGRGPQTIRLSGS